jgi:DNA-binding CsgD family transcriptional regulator/PAS domain-containing protein
MASQVVAARERFTGALQSALSLDEVGEAFMSNATTVVHADAFGLYRFDAGEPTPVEVLSDAEGEFLSRYEDYGRDDDPVLQFAMLQRRPIDSSRATSPERWEKCGARAALREAGLTHSLEAPLVADGRVIGTINFARTRTDHGFDTVDLASARVVSEQLSLAIERALRFELTGRRTTMLESALDRVPDGIIVSDLDSRVLFRNRAVRRLVESHERGACASQDEFTLRTMVNSAIEQFRQGKKVHAGSVKTSEGHMVVKSWLLGENHATVVTMVNVGEQDDSQRLPALSVLSSREQEIAQLVSEGLTAREIADRAFITENTVKQHLKRIFAKTDVRNRAELVQLIWTAGSK